MPIDPALQLFIEQLQRLHPPLRDADDLPGQVQRYAAMALQLPSVLVPVTAGDFKLRAAGRSLRSRLYWPTGAHQPVLMAWFIGGAWAAGTLDTHDGLGRQMAHDLGVAVACIEITPSEGKPGLHACDDALASLTTLADGRAKLGVKTDRLLVGGDGSGAHLALQAAWRLQRSRPGCIESVLALYPLVKPDFNTASYVRCANAAMFSRHDAMRAWQRLLDGQWQAWDERAVLLHANAPLQAAPSVVLVAAEHDVAHDDAIHLHDWLRSVGVHCEFFGAPRMPHDFARMQHASPVARKLMEDALGAFGEIARLRQSRA